MISAEKFHYAGNYRVQGKKSYSQSKLIGSWVSSAKGILTSEEINLALECHSCWSGQTILMRPAVITKRTGQFASQMDILYKRDLFSNDVESSLMVCDIVDVAKGMSLWKKRLSLAHNMFDVDSLKFLQNMFLEDCSETVANELLLHEGGHFIGYDINSKMSDSYFKINENYLWPLIFLEEMRADFHAFGLASKVLDIEAASKVFLFTVVTRLVAHVEGIVNSGIAPYGAVPYFLYHFLFSNGFLGIKKVNDRYVFSIKCLCIDKISKVMMQCEIHALELVTLPEFKANGVIDAATCSANYARSRFLDSDVLSGYDVLMNNFIEGIKHDKRETSKN